MALTAVPLNMLGSDAQFYGFKNRIINGAMMIDQRNAGAAVTVNSGTDFFPVDRFLGVGTSASGVFTLQQSSTAPDGFAKSIVATVTTADASVSSTDQYYISQIIEGLNLIDLAWGTASAESVTLSFWVRSSVVGTYSGSVRNSATDRAYAFTYSISSANTWEKKSITIAGDTSGTWLKTSGVGMHVVWSLGVGSSRLTTANSWAAGNYKGATGETQWIATNGATFYITGVQLEKGTTASSFDYRSHSVEQSLCDRYCRTLKSGLVGFTPNTTSARVQCTWRGMRATPTPTLSGTLTVTDNSVNSTQSSASITDNGSDADGGQLIINNLSGLTANRVAAVLSSSTGSIILSAEL